MSFEKFVPARKARKQVVKPPVAKILKGGQLSLNKPAYQAYLKGATHVELFYDSTANKIGLKPKKYPTKAAFKLRAVGKGKATYRVNAKQLADYYHIRVEKKTSVTPTWNHSEGILEIAL